MAVMASEAELAEAVRDTSEALAIVGGGTRGIVPTGKRLPVSGLSGISLYEPGALTLVAGAGTPLSEIATALEAEGQRLPFEPTDLRTLTESKGTPTIGGVVAGNVSGPRRVQAGACRDSLIGVRFIDGNGQVLKNGGRVMKNVTGYDLVKLLCGSYGTLGVLTEVAFKVLPAPEATGTVLIEGLSDARAVEAMSLALGSPYEVSGAAHLQVGLDDNPVTMIRIEGFADQVTYRCAQLQGLLSEFGESVIETDPQRAAAGWQYVRDVENFAGMEGDVWRVSVKPTDGPKVASTLPNARVVYDWGGGLLWMLVPQGTDLRRKMGDLSGHATIVRAAQDTIERLGRFHPEPAPVAAISSGLRAKFDPRGILNPGVMG